MPHLGEHGSHDAREPDQQARPCQASRSCVSLHVLGLGLPDQGGDVVVIGVVFMGPLQVGVFLAITDGAPQERTTACSTSSPTRSAENRSGHGYVLVNSGGRREDNRPQVGGHGTAAMRFS